MSLITHQLEVVRGGVRELEMADARKVEQDINRLQNDIVAQASNLFRNKYAGENPMGEYANWRDIAKQRDQGALPQGTRTSGSN